MATRPARSLRHEYALYAEEEIENYKESIPRSALLAIGDEAVSALATQPQLALTELLLTEEVDRIIFRRLRLPSYDSWRRRRLKLLEEMRRPEHWGLHPDDVLVRTICPSARAAKSPATAQVLVAGAAEGPALFLAANGCDVTVADEEDVVSRVMSAAAAAGITDRVRSCAADLTVWTPEAELQAVVVTAAALKELSSTDRQRVIEVLKGATVDGGVHLVQSIAAGRSSPSLSELESRYEGWSVSVEHVMGQAGTFYARKELA